MDIVGCGIFQTELEAILRDREGTPPWVSPGLHVEDSRLEAGLGEALRGRRGVACLYGSRCHPATLEHFRCQVERLLEGLSESS